MSVNVLSATGKPNSNGYYGSAYLAYGSAPSFSSSVGITSIDPKIYSITLNPTYKVVRVQFAITAGCSITLKAVKLEIGSVSTLANDAPPNYAAELAKCQRYFQRFRTESERKSYCEDFRPTMRMTDTGEVSLSTITVGSATYYTASADL